MNLNIKEIKIYLLQKCGEINPETGKRDYNKISTAIIDCTKLSELSDEETIGVVSLIYKELLDNNKDKKYDAVGILMSNEDGIYSENSIDMAVLDDISKYSLDDVDSFEEFFKMSLKINEE